MAIQVTCNNCHNTYRYRSEIFNIGTLWHPISAVYCENCGELNAFDEGQHDYLLDVLFEENDNPPGLHTEFWLQIYLKDNADKYGISNIQGPFSSGPDFKGRYNGKDIDIEVEWSCNNYIQHKHHLNPKWDKTELMVVFYPSPPSDEIKNLVPAEIINLDQEDFREWFVPKADKYIKNHNRNHTDSRFWSLVTGEFQRRYYDLCSDKNRELITCPDCDLCPYNGMDFNNIAILFVQTHFEILQESNQEWPNLMTPKDIIRSMEPEEFNEFMKIALYEKF